MNTMNRLCFLLMFLALGMAGACRQTDIRTVAFAVPQVTNAACEARVRAALQRLKGIDHPAMVFDLAAGTVTIRYDSMVLANKNIEHVIIAAGFDANELKADPAARAALPPECRGQPAATNAPPTSTAP